MSKIQAKSILIAAVCLASGWLLPGQQRGFCQQLPVGDTLQMLDEELQAPIRNFGSFEAPTQPTQPGQNFGSFENQSGPSISDSSINSPAPQFAPLPNRSSVAPSTPAHSEIALPRIQYIDPQLPLQTSTPIGGVNNSSPQFSPTQLEQQPIQQQVPLPPQIGPVAPAPQGSFTTNITAPSTPQSSIGSLWWKTAVTEPLATDHATEQITVDSLLYAALQNSQQIQFISKEPLTREQEITTADAEFDPTAFASSVYEDTVDPVGNDLTTLSDPFLEENIWSGEAGIRRKTRSGGQVEVFQQLGFQNSNSQFFNPQDQGTSTLGLNFNQPLLSGGGKIFNRSQILLAQASTDLAWEEFSAQLQDELLNVVEAYWELYFRRAVFLQIQRNVKRGEAILRKVEGRMGLDSLPSQVARSRSEVQSRRTELSNAFRDVRNAETEIRRLVSDPDWLSKQTIEMLPAETPVTETVAFPLKNVVYTAIENRPEIKAAVQKAKAAEIQTRILTNELLPDLALLFSTYVSALEGDSGIENAFQQQFSSTPGFSIGLEYELPYRNRAARSRHTRSRIQGTRVYHEIQQTTLNVIAEAQVAYHRVISAVETLSAAELAVTSARLDLNQNRKRWENFALLEGDLAEGQTPTLVLDQLLDSQERLTDAEFTYSEAIRELKVSQVSLRRATGTLLTVNDVTFNRSSLNNQPTLNLSRAGTRGQQPFLIDPRGSGSQDYEFQQQGFASPENYEIQIPEFSSAQTPTPLKTQLPEQPSQFQNEFSNSEPFESENFRSEPYQPEPYQTEPYKGELIQNEPYTPKPYRPIHPFGNPNESHQEASAPEDFQMMRSVVEHESNFATEPFATPIEPFSTPIEPLASPTEPQAPQAPRQASGTYSDFFDGQSQQNGPSFPSRQPLRR